MLVQTREQFEGVRTALAAADVIVLDTETTGLHPHQGDRLCGVATRCEVRNKDVTYSLSAYFPFRHKPGNDLFSQSENIPWEWFGELMQVLNRPDSGLVLIEHNWKFDTTMFMYEGYDLSRVPFFCTQIASWLNCEWESHRLKDLHDSHIPHSQSKARQALIQKYVKKEGSYDQVPPALMEPYACGDVDDTWDVFEWVIGQLDEQGLTQLLPREFEFARQLFDMEWYGIGCDLDMCQKLSDEAAHRMRELEDEIGFDPLKNAELARRLFLPPPVGLGLTPDSLTKTSSPDFPSGIPALRQEFLSRHLDQPLVASVVEYKRLVKARSTWFNGFLELASKSKDGRLHTTFNGSSGSKSKMGVQGKSSTVTGRLNSSGPNMQQTPREEEVSGDGEEQAIFRRVKKLYIPARQRWGLYEFDYKQIEVRLGAGYGQATLMLEALRNGADPHRVTAERIRCSRQTAKHATYTILYGGQASTLAATIERLEFQTTGKIITYPVNEAQEIMDAYFDLYPGFKAIAQEASKLIKERGYVTIWNGRHRHYERWFDAEKKRWIDNTHKAFNSIVQGGAAEIIKTTMLSIPRKDYAYRVVSQVHDSLWIEIVNDFREEWIEELKWLMEWPSRDERFQVPFDVDVKCLSLEPFNEAEWLREDSGLLPVG